MSRLYVILSVAGWAWLVIVSIFLIVRLTLVRKTPPRGFDVVDPRAADVPPRRGGVRDAR
jgi:hypothetical protein